MFPIYQSDDKNHDQPLGWDARLGAVVVPCQGVSAALSVGQGALGRTQAHPRQVLWEETCCPSASRACSRVSMGRHRHATAGQH